MIRTIRRTYDAPALKARDLRALRSAETVVFRHVDGAGSRLELTRANPAHVRNPLEPRELAHDIAAGDYLLGAMTRDPRAGGREPAGFSAFDMISAAQLCPEWRTVVESLRAGDRMALVWYLGGCETPALRDAGFTGDFVRLEALRGEGARERRLTWRVGQQTTRKGPFASHMITLRTVAAERAA